MEWTVGALMAELEDCNPEAIIVLSSDPEGNSYNTLHNFEEMVYDEGYKEVGYSELTEELREWGYGDGDVISDGRPAVVLWPS